MAISGVRRTFDNATSIREDLEGVVAMISPTDTPLFTLADRQEVNNTKHEWIEDSLRTMTSELASALAKDTTSVKVYVTSGDGAAKFPIASGYPMLFRINEEMFLGTSRTTNCITATRNYDAGGTGAHTAAVTIEILADLSLEGSDAPSAFSQSRSRGYNYTQVFTQKIKVSGSDDAVTQAGVVTESDYQAEQRLKELGIMVERSMISGVRTQASASAYGSLGGIRSFISTNNNNAAAAAVTRENIEADLQACYDNGGEPNLLVCGSFQARKISSLFADEVRREPEDILGGNVITRILSPVAGMGQIAILVNRWVPKHEYYVIDSRLMKLGVLRAFFLKDLAETGDARQQQVIGEYTLVLKNEAAHARRYNLAIS